MVECPDPLSTAACQIHLYEGLEELGGAVLTSVVYSVEPRYFPYDEYEDRGFLSGIAVLDDRVVVAAFGGNELPLPWGHPERGPLLRSRHPRGSRDHELRGVPA